MALIFIDGFDHLASADVDDKYSDSAQGGIDTTTFRSGLGSLDLDGGSGQISAAVPNQVTYIVGFGFYLSTPQTLATKDLVNFNEDSPSQGTHVTLQITGDRKFRVIRGQESDFFEELGKTTDRFDLSDGFHYIEFKVTVDDSTGSFELKFDEESILSGTSLDTRNNDATHCPLGVIKQIVFNEIPGSPVDTWYDDLYICDATGTKNNDFLGDCQVTTIFPKADGALEDWALSTGSDSFAMVDENPPDDDSTYVQSNVSTEQDSFDMDDVSSMITILGAQLTIYARFLTGSASIKHLARVGGTNYLGNTKVLAATYDFHMHMFEDDPDISNNWTISGLNAAEFGMEVV